MLENGYNQFTRDCDKYLTNGYELDDKYPFVTGTYLYNKGYLECTNSCDLFPNTFESCYVCFRVPGATRGHIEIDGSTMIITDVVFYDDTCFDYPSGTGCYKREIWELREKYIGTVYSVD